MFARSKSLMVLNKYLIFTNPQVYMLPTALNGSKLCKEISPNLLDGFSPNFVLCPCFPVMMVLLWAMCIRIWALHLVVNDSQTILIIALYKIKYNVTSFYTFETIANLNQIRFYPFLLIDSRFLVQATGSSLKSKISVE